VKLSSTMILLAVSVVLPLMVLLVALLTRPRKRRLLGAFVGGFAYALMHITWDTLASLAGWWRFVGGPHAPLWYYVGSLFWGVCTALLGWRVQRQFGLRGAAIYLLGMAVIGTVNDYVGKAALDASAIIAFAPGFAPVVADLLCCGTNALTALLAMHLVSGPASADHPVDTGSLVRRVVVVLATVSDRLRAR
jgi:hypothetical protein